MAEDCLSELQRAEDIILGGLGLDTCFKIIEIKKTTLGFSGKAKYNNEVVDFENEFELDDLDKWALDILIKAKK